MTKEQQDTKPFRLKLYEAEMIVSALEEELLSLGQIGDIWHEQLEETKSRVRIRWANLIVRKINKVAQQPMSVRQRQKL